MLLGKSRVFPNKFISIHRLELTAAVLPVKVACLLRKELQIDGLKERFWTDSQVVLTYIRSNSKLFKVFVTNSIHQIKQNARFDQWYYVSSKENPDDDASRGLNPRKKTSNTVVVGFMGHHFYDKWKHLFGPVKAAAYDH